MDVNKAKKQIDEWFDHHTPEEVRDKWEKHTSTSDVLLIPERAVSLMSMAERLEAYFDSLSEEELEKVRQEFGGEDIPEGWVSIEDHLPGWLAVDVAQGYSEYAVKDEVGTVFVSRVADHDMWYYYAKETDITHWYNGDINDVLKNS